MGLNNWSVASKVRKGITFSNLPIVSSYIDVKFTVVELLLGVSGISLAFWLFSLFPTSQMIQGIMAAGLTVLMTLYLMMRPSSNPEKNNFQIMISNTFTKPKRHYKHLELDDLEGYK